MSSHDNPTGPTGPDGTPAGETGGSPGGRPGAGRPPGRGSLTAELGAELRAIRVDLTATSTTARTAADTVAKVLPRLDGIEAALGELGAAVNTLTGPADEPDPDPPVATPAMTWHLMSEDEAAQAWEALGEWVGDTLCGRYRIAREQLPDCWPLHPQAVLELAWLRTLHLAATHAAPKAPGMVAEWHTRWYPAAMTNLLTAIDRRECGPGYHRLTEQERIDHHQALLDARTRGVPWPQVTAETGAARPRYMPDRFPPARRFQPPAWDPSLQGAPPSPPHDRMRRTERNSPPDPPFGCSGRPFWHDLFEDAAQEDLAQRHAAAGTDQD